MSMISEQVKELRELADGKIHYCEWKKSEILNQATDTIEALSAKLSEANMERSDRYYGGGWIACDDRLPEEGKDVLVYLKQGRMTVAARIGKEWVRPDETRTAIVVAWRELPEPYRP